MALYVASEDEKSEIERVRREIASDDEEEIEDAKQQKDCCCAVGVPKREKKKGKEEEDLPPARRVRTIREDALRELADVPPAQIDPAVHAREMARLATPEGRWAMARTLMLGHQKSAGLLSELPEPLLHELIRNYVFPPMIRGTIAVSSRRAIVEDPDSGDKELIFMHTLPESVQVSKLSDRQLKAALEIAHGDAPDVCAVVAERILVLWVDDEVYAAYFRADGTAEHVEHLGGCDEPDSVHVAYASKVHFCKNTEIFPSPS